MQILGTWAALPSAVHVIQGEAGAQSGERMRVTLNAMGTDSEQII